MEKTSREERCDAHSPMDVLRMGMASPFRSFLGLLKPPALPQIVGCEDQSPRSSSITAAEIESLFARQTLDAEMSSTQGSAAGQRVVMVAFDATVKELSHGGIVWAMENVLRRGDVLAVVSVLDSVRGPLGYRVKVGDRKWLSANQRLVEDEIEQRMEAWRSFPGLMNRCAEGGVKLLVTVKAAQRGEFAICREAVRLGASHVVLDKSLKNRRREVYLQNLACDVTRMRRSGGVEVIRPCLELAAEPRSPTSVIPTPLLSYGDQIDVFEISLGAPKPKRAVASPPSSSGSELPYSGELKSRTNVYSGEIPYSGEMKSAELRKHAYSGELPFSGELKLRANAYSAELRRLPSSAVLASSFDRSSSSMSVSTTSGAQARSSCVSAATSSSAQTSSFTSSSNDDATANDHHDDDLFSIFHGSTRHDADAAEDQLSTSGYESDDLFSIGNASTRRTSPAPALEHHSIPKYPAARSCLVDQSVVSEPLREATISRIAFMVGLGEAVTLSLQDALRPGEGLLVGSSPSALFLMRSGHGAALATATPGSYIAMEGRMAMKLAFLEAGQRVLVVDALGRCRAVGVRGACAAGAPLVLVEALCEGRRWSTMLHHMESMALCHLRQGMVSVKGLQLGDRMLLRLRSAEPSHAIWSS